MRPLGPGSYVITPEGRVGLWTSTTEGVALVMSGDDRILVRTEELRSAFWDASTDRSTASLCKDRL